MITDQQPSPVYTGQNLRAVAMPLGGIGTGTIALAGDGSLRQWQIHNQINHLACVPHSFFAIYARTDGGEPVARVLQSDALYDDETMDATPPATSNDHVVPLPQRRLMRKLPGIEGVAYSGTYPIAELEYIDPALPVAVSLEAFSPFIPLNSKDSGLPAIIFTFTLTNTSAVPVSASIAASLQNAIGWDGIREIFNTRSQLYGGNINETRREHGATAILMRAEGQDTAHPGHGTMALTAHTDAASSLAHWDDLDAFWNDFSADGRFQEIADAGPSRKGRTWNGALAVPVELDPGQSRQVTFSIAWHLPNRYVDQAQAGLLGIPKDDRLQRIGNMYATWFGDAGDVSAYVHEHLASLGDQTRLARDLFRDTTLPRSLIDTVTSQMSIARTPTCFWTEDGLFYGFEGCNGASTLHHTLPWGGCCPLNCTHVWNYEMAVARLFPDLERTMRDIEWSVQQHPSGYLPHRVVLPIDRPRPWSGQQHAPDKPALDGLLGAILKTYREYRAGGDTAWLRQYWQALNHALDYVWATYDPDRRGVIEGEQPNTYDISIFGLNTFIGTLYLAALRAVEEMAMLLDEPARAATCREIFERGRERLDAELWLDDYYIQKVDLDQHAEQNWATGCHADQLLGQWWADILDLGDLLDPDRLRTAARSIVKYNFRERFPERKGMEREFVAPDDQGLIICTWPHGGRPEVPTRYSDEVWTGLEYEVAALLLHRGETDLAMQVIDAVRGRHDGRLQNPWNDIECGDHYVRAMASWALLEAASGFTYDAASASIGFAPVFDPADYRAPFIARDGWGAFTQHIDTSSHTVQLEMRWGYLDVASIMLCTDRDVPAIRATIGERPVTVEWRSSSPGRPTVDFASPVTVRPGEALTMALS